jgi:hypothetical protein
MRNKKQMAIGFYEGICAAQIRYCAQVKCKTKMILNEWHSTKGWKEFLAKNI